MKNNKKAILYVLIFLFWASLYSHMSILSGRAEEVGASTLYIGLISGAYGLMQFLFRFPLGIWSDRKQKYKIFIAGGLISSAVAGLVMFLFPAPAGLLAGRALCGLSASTYVQITVLLTSYYDDAHIPKAMGMLSAMTNLAQISVMFIAGIVADAFGKEYTFLMTTILAVAGLGLSLLVKDKPGSKDEGFTLQDLKIIGGSRMLIVAGIVAIVLQIVSFGRNWAFVPLAANRMGASALQQSLITITFTAVSMVTSLLASGLARRFGMVRIIAIGFVFHSLSSFLIPVLPTLPGLYISQVLSGIGYGILFPMLMSLALGGTQKRLRGTATGLYQAAYALGMFAGPVIFGGITQKYPFNYMVTGVLSLLGILLTLLLLREKKQDIAHT